MEYRIITQSEENGRERLLATLGCKFFSAKLNIPEVPVRFILRSHCGCGDITCDEPVLGLARGRREIFLHCGLSERQLLRTLGHECRHIWQVISGKHCRDSKTRERDCRIYELEINLPNLSGRELRLWLLRESEFERDPGLRQIYTAVDRVFSQGKYHP